MFVRCLIYLRTSVENQSKVYVDVSFIRSCVKKKCVCVLTTMIVHRQESVSFAVD